MRSFKDKNIQNKQVDYNSDRLSNLTCILAGKLQIFGTSTSEFLTSVLLNHGITKQSFKVISMMTVTIMKKQKN